MFESTRSVGVLLFVLVVWQLRKKLRQASSKAWAFVWWYSSVAHTKIEYIVSLRIGIYRRRTNVNENVSFRFRLSRKRHRKSHRYHLKCSFFTPLVSCKCSCVNDIKT